MITFGTYKDYRDNDEIVFSISADKGICEEFRGNYCTMFMPNKLIYDVWYYNLRNLNNEENDRYFIRDYYIQNLLDLNPEEVLEIFKRDKVLFIDYEDSVVSDIIIAWFDILLDTVVEKRIDSMKNINRRKKIKHYLEDTIRSLKNMGDFESFKAFYLFERSIILEKEAASLERIYPDAAKQKRKLSHLYRDKAQITEKLYKDSSVKSCRRMQKKLTIH